MNEVTPPLNVTQLNARLAQVATTLNIPIARARAMLCTLIVSQMLPETVSVKGGMGVKLRFGERGTRATTDLDVSTRDRGEEFGQAFRARVWPRDGEACRRRKARCVVTQMRQNASRSPQPFER